MSGKFRQVYFIEVQQVPAGDRHGVHQELAGEHSNVAAAAAITRHCCKLVCSFQAASHSLLPVWMNGSSQHCQHCHTAAVLLLLLLLLLCQFLPGTDVNNIIHVVIDKQLSSYMRRQLVIWDVREAECAMT
jgi:hypothetical protein